MAKETIVRIIDDIDGSAPAETVSFGYRGTVYSIDLSDANARSLAALFEPYIASGRRERASSPKVGKAASSGPKINLDEVRDWANKNGHKVADRGRIAGSIMDAFNATSKAEPAVVRTPPAVEEPADSSSLTPTLDEIRAWATRNGHKVAGRGRIAHSIVDAFQSAAKAAGNVLSPEPEAQVIAPARKAPAKKVPAKKAPAKKALAKKAPAGETPAKKPAPAKAAKTSSKKVAAKRTTARKRAASSAAADPGPEVSATDTVTPEAAVAD